MNSGEQEKDKELEKKMKTWNPNNFSAKSPLRNQIYYEHFIQNSHKYAELISFLKFYPDIYYDMIKPQGKGGLVFDDYQRMQLRILARFFDAYLCIPRRNWKDFNRCIIFILFSNILSTEYN